MGKEIDFQALYFIAQELEGAYTSLENISELQGQDEEDLVTAMKCLDKAMEFLSDQLEEYPNVH